MSGSDIRRRSILVGCKYQSRAEFMQHDEAKLNVSKFLSAGNPQISTLHHAAMKLRERMADDDFSRDLFDHNADYIDRFAKVFNPNALPAAERLAPGKCPAVMLGGVKVTPDIQLRLQRLTKSNKVRVGAVTFRYAKGKALKPETGAWQSAFIMGYLLLTGDQEDIAPELSFALHSIRLHRNMLREPNRQCVSLQKHGGSLRGHR